MARIKKHNIEKEVNEGNKEKYLSDGWEEINISYKSMKIPELKAVATEKGLEFAGDIKKDELIQLLEGAE